VRQKGLLDLISQFICSLIVCSCCLSFLRAQPAASSKHVGVVPKDSIETIKRGGDVLTTIALRIADGWHINAHEPSQEYMIGTKLTFESNEELSVVGITYPKATITKLSQADEPLRVYDGTVSILVRIKAPLDAEAGRRSLKGTITVQACNDKVCLPPSSLPVAIPVEVIQ
jgi:thiol:disulfide interchange protein DsbD